MIVLDTNIVSALMQTEPDVVVEQWVDSQPSLSVWTTAITVFELRFGIARLPIGRKRSRLEAFLDTVLADYLQGRVVPLDQHAAAHAATLAAQRQASGFNVAERDTFIAGIVLAHRATIATRNVRHFRDLGIRVVNPWDDGNDARP